MENKGSVFKELGRTKIAMLAITMGLVVALIPFSIDGYLVAFPTTAKEFGVPLSQVQFSMTLFMLGFSISQLFYGPICDHFGHIRVFLIMTFFTSLVSLACAFSPSMPWFNSMRLLQSITMASGGVVVTSIVALLFPLNEALRFFSLIAAIFGIAPIISPTVGKFIFDLFSWRAIFVFIAIISPIAATTLALTVPYKRIKQKQNKKEFSFSNIVNSYKTILKDKNFVIYTVVASLVTSTILTMVTASPGIFMQHYGLTQNVFTLIFGAMTSGLLLGTQTNPFLLKKFNPRSIIKGALSIAAIAGVIGGFFGYFDLHPFLIVATTFFVIFSIGILIPNATALATEGKGENTGTASSIFGSARFFLGAIATIFLNYSGSTHPWLGTFIMSIGVVLAYFIYIFYSKAP